MKALKYLIILLILIGFTFQSCKDNDEGGDPSITYVRVTDPDKADSLLVAASMGNLIAIVGDNLGDVVEVWFNDQEALLTPTYVTDKSILLNVPSLPPTDITNKITLVLRDGRSFQFDFTVTVPAPELNSMKCEYVPDGDVAELNGNYFFEPMTVTFPGDLQGEIVEVTQKIVKVKVPEGAQPGQIEVKTNFGKAVSTFRFRDNRGLILDFDEKLGAGWHWHPEHLQDSAPTAVSGNYYKFEDENLTADKWNDANLEADLWGQSAGLPEGPLWDGGIYGKALKFEANVVEEWNGGYMQFIFLPWNNANNSGHTNNAFAKGLWKPWVVKENEYAAFKTDGWITVTIPLSEFRYDHNANVVDPGLIYPDNCGSLSIFIRGPIVPADPNHVFICIDNVRVVDL